MNRQTVEAVLSLVMLAGAAIAQFGAGDTQAATLYVALAIWFRIGSNQE